MIIHWPRVRFSKLENLMQLFQDLLDVVHGSIQFTKCVHDVEQTKYMF